MSKYVYLYLYLFIIFFVKYLCNFVHLFTIINENKKWKKEIENCHWLKKN